MAAAVVLCYPIADATADPATIFAAVVLAAAAAANRVGTATTRLCSKICDWYHKYLHYAVFFGATKFDTSGHCLSASVVVVSLAVNIPAGEDTAHTHMPRAVQVTIIPLHSQARGVYCYGVFLLGEPGALHTNAKPYFMLCLNQSNVTVPHAHAVKGVSCFLKPALNNMIASSN